MNALSEKLNRAYNDYYNACDRRELTKKVAHNAWEASNLAADEFRATVREVADALRDAEDAVTELREQHSVMVATLKDAKEKLSRPASDIDLAGVLSGIDAALIMIEEYAVYLKKP